MNALKNERLHAIGHLLLKIAVPTIAAMSIATTILAQPVDSPSTPNPNNVTVVPQPAGDTNWGLIGVILTGAGGIIATVMQSRNSSMSLQVNSLEKQQQSLSDERKLLQQQTFDQIANLKSELAEERNGRKELTARSDKLEDEIAELMRENMKLQAKCSLQEVEIASLKLQLSQKS